MVYPIYIPFIGGMFFMIMAHFFSWDKPLVGWINYIPLVISH